MLTEGVHSGDSSGVVPSSLRQLLDQLEDSATGRLLPARLHCEVPAERVEQARVTARTTLGDEVWKRFPWARVLGPNSNAHGPNEFLYVPYAKKLTAAVAQVIAASVRASAAAPAASA